MDLFESSTDSSAYSPADKRTIYNYIKSQALINFQLGLHDKLQTIVRSRAPATLADAIAGAVEEERIQGFRGPPDRESVRPHQGQATTFSRGPFNRESVRPQQGQAPNFSRNPSLTTCAKCGKIGHYGQDCRTSRYANRFALPRPEYPPTVRTADKYCNYCKRNGHTREECRTLKRETRELTTLAATRHDYTRNAGNTTGENRVNYQRNSPTNEGSASDPPAKRTREAREFQANYIKGPIHAPTGTFIGSCLVHPRYQRHRYRRKRRGHSASYNSRRGDRPRRARNESVIRYYNETGTHTRRQPIIAKGRNLTRQPELMQRNPEPADTFFFKGDRLTYRLPETKRPNTFRTGKF